MFGEQTKMLTENIEAAHRARKAAVTGLARETSHFLNTFHKEHEAMAKAMRASLASAMTTRSQHTRAMLDRFSQECAEQAAALRSELNAFHTHLSETVGEMRGRFAAEHHQAHAAWQRLARAKSKKAAR
jgi:hypothetical protein